MDTPTLQNFTDIHISLSGDTDKVMTQAMEKSLIFPGPMPITAEFRELVEHLVELTGVIKKEDFMVTWGDFFFRGHRDSRTVDGTWLRLRRMSNEPPTLDKLPSPMPSYLKKLLVSPHLLTGGLVYVIGSPGSGKTTSCSAALVSRLADYGGFAYTVEDPPEMPLNGWHERGYCSQTWVAGDSVADWHEAFRGVVRSQPTKTTCILFVGEVRDRESAAALLRAAASGFLVLATGFGTDIPSALDTLIRLAADGSDLQPVIDSISNVLRLVVHQRLEQNRLNVRVLASAHGRSPVAARIRAGSLPHLEGDIQYQNNLFSNGMDIFQEHLRQVAA